MAPRTLCRTKPFTSSLHLCPWTSNLSLTVALTIHLLFPMHTLSEDCESTCGPREWRRTCDDDCEECPQGTIDDPYPIVQRVDWNPVFDGGDTVRCDYYSQLYSKGAGEYIDRVEVFHFPMPSSELKDTCATSVIDVSYGAWPDNVTQSDLKCVAHDENTVCVNRCRNVCSQYPECSMVDYDPTTNHCRLFKQGARVAGTSQAAAFVLSKKATRGCITKDGHHVTPPVATTTTTAVKTTECPPCDLQFWRPSCSHSCRSCPAVDQDADDVPQANVDDIDIPTDPITCDFDIVHGFTADDDGNKRNRVAVFPIAMLGGDICLTADMNIDVGGWPSRLSTHRERCMELCAQHPECGMADLSLITSDCRLYRCSAKRTRSTKGHVLLVKRAGTCKDLPDGIDDDGGGCTFSTSDHPTVLPTLAPESSSPSTSSPSQLPTPMPTSLPTILPSVLPSSLPTHVPSGHPSTDPCVSHACVLDCIGVCGWNADAMLCQSGKVTTQLELESLAGCSANSTTLVPSPNIDGAASSPVTTSTVLVSVGIALVIVISVSVVSFVYVRTQFYHLEKETEFQGDFVIAEDESMVVHDNMYETTVVEGYPSNTNNNNKSQISHM
eukprot:m.74215 g.74215  ORF g.74215 m.74215 type:complete len:610 (+) comp24637_c3_seq1:301-2130(+)